MNAKKLFTIANYGKSANSIAGKQLNGPITIFPFTIARFIIASCDCNRGLNEGRRKTLKINLRLNITLWLRQVKLWPLIALWLNTGKYRIISL